MKLKIGQKILYERYDGKLIPVTVVAIYPDHVEVV
jgi:hypothetical protein